MAGLRPFFNSRLRGVFLELQRDYENIERNNLEDNLSLIGRTQGFLRNFRRLFHNYAGGGSMQGNPEASIVDQRLNSIEDTLSDLGLDRFITDPHATRTYNAFDLEATRHVLQSVRDSLDELETELGALFEVDEVAELEADTDSSDDDDYLEGDRYILGRRIYEEGSLNIGRQRFQAPVLDAIGGVTSIADAVAGFRASLGADDRYDLPPTPRMDTTMLYGIPELDEKEDIVPDAAAAARRPRNSRRYPSPDR